MTTESAIVSRNSQSPHGQKKKKKASLYSYEYLNRIGKTNTLTLGFLVCLFFGGHTWQDSRIIAGFVLQGSLWWFLGSICCITDQIKVSCVQGHRSRDVIPALPLTPGTSSRTKSNPTFSLYCSLLTSPTSSLFRVLRNFNDFYITGCASSSSGLELKAKEQKVAFSIILKAKSTNEFQFSFISRIL